MYLVNSTGHYPFEDSPLYVDKLPETCIIRILAEVKENYSPKKIHKFKSKICYSNASFWGHFSL
jgi:hypothetical protein